MYTLSIINLFYAGEFAVCPDGNILLLFLLLIFWRLNNIINGKGSLLFFNSEEIY